MNAEIISVGSELLLGQIANTNAQFISKELAEIGVNVFYHTAVGDNHLRIKDIFLQAKERSNLIIFTGGLGPTKDDLTKETIADALGLSLEMDEPSLQQIEAFFQKRNIPMTENNKKQALVLEGSDVFYNRNGMAPGMAITSENTCVILLPGPPKEIRPMFKDVKKYLVDKLHIREIIHSVVLRFFGIGEAKIETELLDLIENQTNPTIAPLAAEGEVTIRLTAKEASIEKASELIKRVEEQILKRVGEFFYGYDETSLFEELKTKLIEKKATVSSAESLTGGLFSQKLTAFPGVSSIFQGGIVSYATSTKEHVLQVSRETLEQEGAVSSATAKAMAEQVRLLCKSTFGISFTGVAGPDKQEGKEVGTVFIGIAHEHGKTEVYPLTLSGTRNQIRDRAVKFGSYYLLKELKRWN